MKFTLSWLRTHLDTQATLAEITDRLTAIGLELEGVEDRGAALAPFRIAEVVEAVQHPNADRLRACRVNTGEGIVSVVCGAPNARAGMKAVFAPPGSFVPGTGITLKVGEIRGVESAGMLLSLREMGLGEDHSGIVDLPVDAPVGEVYATWAGLDDPVIDIGVTPNRGDALSVRGVARDLAAAGIGTLRPWPAPEVPSHGPSSVTWAIEDRAACPWILGRTVRGVRNGPSPDWLAARLVSIGLRPINVLADITNFFSYDIGRPLHVFDVDRLSGDVLTLRPGAGETFRALNGRDYTVTPDDLVIADAAGVQSLAGVIGGEATGCQDDTTTVFLECAVFDPVRVALTGRRHQITSDARQRFERGIDPALPPDAVASATRMILDLCGGEASEVTVAGAEPAWRRTATMRLSRLAGLGGLDLPPDLAMRDLERLGFGVVDRTPTQVRVSVPSWRNDIAATSPLDQASTLSPEIAARAAEGREVIEPECDVIEEVLRLRGLDTIPPVSLPRAAPVPRPTSTSAQTRTAIARRVLAARGLSECVTFSFMGSDIARQFGPAPEELRVSNPIAADLDQMRPTPLATLVQAAIRNAARGQPDVGLFEIGPGYDDTAPQRLIAAGLRAGATPRHWLAASRPDDVIDVKADLMAALEAIGVPLAALTVTTNAPGFYHPGRSGVVRQGPTTVVGHFGALHPRTLAALDTQVPMVAFELFMDAVAEPRRRRKSAPDLPNLQPVRRDFAFLVAADIPAEAILRAARGADRTLIADVSLFDVYAGDKVPAGQKSVGIEVVFQPRDQTMTDAEIEAASARVVAAAAKATGAVLR